MRILYGLNGEGMGHAMRTVVVASHLASRGHSLEFVTSSGRAYDFISSKFPGKVHKVVGLSMSMKGNALQPLATFAKNLLAQTVASPFAHLGTALCISRPDAVISDFDPWTARYASYGKIPLLAIDNIHFMNRCRHPAGLVAGSKGDRDAASLMFPITAEMVPDADRYMVTTFAEAETRLPRTTLHAPILRKEILSREKTVGSHVVVYMNDKGDGERLIGVLKRVSEVPFVVYAAGGSQFAGGNVSWREFSQEGFLRDFLSSRAVIGGAGFTLMTEAIYSQKPMLALPFEGQFEQILNANYLQGCGFGERAKVISTGTVQGFLGRSDVYRERLRGLKHDGNQELLSSVDGWLRRWES